MLQHRFSRWQSRPSLPFILLCVLLSAVWAAGGAARADVTGQVVIRSVAWSLVTIAILFARRPPLQDARPLLLLMAGALSIALMQLVPLPPSIWQSLPGRAVFAQAATASGQSQPWRPWSIVPDATLNAAFSLIVPAATLLFLAGLNDEERRKLPGLILGLITASMVVGLLQFSGAGFDNPLINDAIGDVSGTFANRNHFALLLALGCLLAPVWVFLDGHQPRWRSPIAFGLVLLFALTILASGSRAGLGLGALGLAVGLVLVRGNIERALRRYPRWVFLSLIVGIVGVVVFVVLISVAVDRAVSIDRVLAMDAGQDMRRRGLPTVLAMIRAYFPVGSGLGSFDPVFRLHEPFFLLQLTYFNHAHNDLLEIVLDTGLPGLMLMLAGLAWWTWASVRAWRAGSDARFALPKLGSAMLLLIIIASAFDYPASTPTVMVMIVVAGMWLNGRVKDSGAPALPRNHRLL